MNPKSKYVVLGFILALSVGCASEDATTIGLDEPTGLGTPGKADGSCPDFLGLEVCDTNAVDTFNSFDGPGNDWQLDHTRRGVISERNVVCQDQRGDAMRHFYGFTCNYEMLESDFEELLLFLDIYNHPDATVDSNPRIETRNFSDFTLTGDTRQRFTARTGPYACYATLDFEGHTNAIIVDQAQVRCEVIVSTPVER